MKAKLTLWRIRPPAEPPAPPPEEFARLLVGSSTYQYLWAVPLDTLDLASPDANYLPYADSDLLAYFMGTDADTWRYYAGWKALTHYDGSVYVAIEYAYTDGAEYVQVAKIDAATMTVTATVELDSPLLSRVAIGICADTDGSHVYVIGDCATGSLRLGVWKIRTSDMTVVDTLNLSGSWSTYSGQYWLHDTCICDESYLYIGATDSASDVHILRVQKSDLTLVDSLKIGESSAGYTNPSHAVVQGAHLYVGANDIDNPTAAPVVLKIDRASFAFVAALPIVTTATAVMDTVVSIASDGTHLYAATSGDTGTLGRKTTLGKVLLSDFSLVSTLDYSSLQHVAPPQAALSGGKLYLTAWRTYSDYSAGPPATGDTHYRPVYEIDTATMTVLRTGRIRGPALTAMYASAAVVLG